jgi:hypothetical protein
MSQQYNLAVSDSSHEILFEPWIQNNFCGGKAWRAVLFPTQQSVIVKLWDGFKSTSRDRDNEVHIYMSMQRLWGKFTTRLILSARVDFFWGIILEEVKVQKT